jgi:hypothetical protein
MSMARKSTALAFVNPWLAWVPIAVSTSELMLTSAQVIGHRLWQFSDQDLSSTERNRREADLMVREKMEAAAESGQAMWLQVMGMNHALWFEAVRRGFALSTAWTALASSSSMADSARRQKRLLRAANRSAETTAALSRASAKVMQSGLQPIHSRASANARRLGR